MKIGVVTAFVVKSFVNMWGLRHLWYFTTFLWLTIFVVNRLYINRACYICGTFLLLLRWSFYYVWMSFAMSYNICGHNSLLVLHAFHRILTCQTNEGNMHFDY